MKTKKQQLIVVPTDGIKTKFSKEANKLVAVTSFKDASRLSPRLARFFARSKKSVQLKSLDRADRWTARFLLHLGAVKEVKAA